MVWLSYGKIKIGKTPRVSTLAGLMVLLCVTLPGCATLDATPLVSPEGTVTTVIMVRHAERDPGSTPPPTEPLNEEGFARAEALADELEDAGITAIYAPDLTRNLQTVEPLAERINITPTRVPVLDTLDTKALANKMAGEWFERFGGGVILWVGNTGPVTDTQEGNLQEIYRRLGGTDDDPPIAYPDLYVITIDDQGAVMIDKRTYNP